MIRNKRLLRNISVAMIFLLLNQVLMPGIAWALTSGPTQPEMQQFTPLSSTDYVDLFTGDFSYNIPLLDVEGFPINLAYHSGATADQEASWVGLGWNINPGVINRQLRGIPDDFEGDKMTQKQNVKDNVTVGVRGSVSGELFGFHLGSEDPSSNNAVSVNLSLSLGLCYNTYKKFGIDYGVSVGASGALNGSFSLENSSQSGFTPSLNLSTRMDENHTTAIGISSGINSREGLQEVTLSANSEVGSHEIQNGKGDNAKSETYGISVGPSVGFSFSKPVFYPGSEFPRSSVNFSFTAKPIGLELFGTFPNTSISGYYFKEGLTTHTITVPSYGWLYEDKGTRDVNALMDLEREKDVPFRKNSINLPVPYAAFDLFDVSGNEINGSYHIQRNDVGILRDRFVMSSSSTGTGGADFGFAAGVHLGLNLNYTSANTTTSGWTDDNYFASKAPFIGVDSNSLYEPAYFKNAGELTVNTGDNYAKTGFDHPAAVKIERSGTLVPAFNEFKVKGINGGIGVPSVLRNSVRMKRQQVLSYLTADDAMYYALDKDNFSYFRNVNPYIDCNSSINGKKVSRNRWPSHHISEITVLNTDGRRYIYGLPAYNTFQKEATFNVEGNTHDGKQGWVTYSGTDDSTVNAKGKDHFYDSKRIAPYAHSYLLTAVLSPDYVDQTGDGITPDDLGQAYKLNYTKMYDNFRWRTPVQHDSAQYNEGMKSVAYDDKGSYVYGTKEIWYLNSIESTNLIAVFVISDRKDGLGVLGEAGGKDTSQKLQKLDRIDLFSKNDLIKNGPNATPIKSVHFDYDPDYSLCQGVPNQKVNGYGKLTLVDIYFTYGKSARGKLNKYKFTYSDLSSFENPDYGTQESDRWGYYTNLGSTYASAMDTIADFPYTIQDKTLADEYAAAWSLRKIELPSGATMKISYESDSYAYVQDKRACQMAFVGGFGDEATDISSETNHLYDGGTNNSYLFLTLPKYVHSSQEFHDLYLDGLDYIYYQMKVDVNADSKYEYVKGYCKYQSYGIEATGDSTNRAWIKLNEEYAGLSLCHPVSLTAWQFLRLNLPEKAYPGSDLSDNASAANYIWAVLSVLPSMMQMVVGFNNTARSQSKGQVVDTAQSFIRLDNPTFEKFGGGSRVKKITLSDNWAYMVDSTQDSYEYGQEYSYTKLEGGRSISSGVASYEPMIGGEENPWREPLYYEDHVPAAPNNTYYTETPLGESLFPSPVIGYSEVMVKNLPHANVTVTGPGYSIYKFYTERDFPVKCDFTNLQEENVNPNPIFKILNINVKKNLTVSQGFSIELNDMHGKPMEEDVYNEPGSMLSQKIYHYKTDNDNAQVKHLNNIVNVVDPAGAVRTDTVGVDFEVYQDMRQQDSKVSGFGIEMNTDAIILGIPIPVPTFYPKFTDIDNLIRLSATTKLIKRYGILDHITVMDNGSQVTTDNLLYDSETGSVLLSKVTNEFEDSIYKFTYPAHWIYDGMGQAYKNISGVFKNVTFTDGVISLGGADNYFHEGDRVGAYVPRMSNEQPKIIYAAKPSGGLVFLNADGTLFDEATPITVRIIQSGYKNLMTTPVASVSSLGNPINATDSIEFATSTKILNADASVFDNLWRIPPITTIKECDSIAPPSCLTDLCLAVLNNTSQFLHPYKELSVEDVLQGECEGFADGDSEIFSVSEGYIGDFPYLIENSDQWPDDELQGMIINIPSFYNLTATMGNCTFYFVNTIGVPLPIEPTGSDDYYSIDVGSSSSNYKVIVYDGPTTSNLPSSSVVGYVYLSCLRCLANSCSTMAEGDTLNPFVHDMLGIWRPEKSFAYNDLRKPLTNHAAVHVETDGTFKSFHPFYTYNGGLNKWEIDSTGGQWIRSGQSILYDAHGNEIESKDALDIHSAAIYRYNQTLPVAVIHNSGLAQSANDNFEDYDLSSFCNVVFCQPHHWDFMGQTIHSGSGGVVDSNAHTGNYSFRLSHGAYVGTTQHVSTAGSDIMNVTGDQYTLGDDAFIPAFAPSAGNYLFSGWMKVDTTCVCKTYGGTYVTITDGATTTNIKPSGPIIDGWQRMEKSFTISPGDTTVSITLKAGPTSGTSTFFDDLRIFPQQANMKSFVYDRRTLRLMATLDENNYATFYEYDEEGNLIRVKKETERGIVTLQEGKSKMTTVVQ